MAFDGTLMPMRQKNTACLLFAVSRINIVINYTKNYKRNDIAIKRDHAHDPQTDTEDFSCRKGTPEKYN